MNDRERQGKEKTDEGRTKNDRKGKQSLRELTKCSGNTTSSDKCREVTLDREGPTHKTKNGKYCRKKEIELQRKQTRTERIDDIQWVNNSERQIYSSDVRTTEKAKKGKN